MKSILVACTLTAAALTASCSTPRSTALLDSQLSHFEVWIGVPHASVQGLPPGTFQSDDVRRGTPMGLNADVKQVFRMVEEDGEPVLRVSGEIYGGLTTLEEYENYHLSLKVRWGSKKWEPRLQQLRDSGILYHCHGAHGSLWNVWKSSLEFQIQETDLGDFIPITGPTAKVRVSPVEGSKRPRFDAQSSVRKSGYTSAWPETDRPHGEWNRLDLYTLGNTSVHVVNGEVVMVVEQAMKKDGTPLTRGQIQLQSEAAECYYTDMRIEPINRFPESIQDWLNEHGY